MDGVCHYHMDTVLGGDHRERRLCLHDEVVIVEVDDGSIGGPQLTGQDGVGELVFDVVLDDSPERPRAIHRVVSFFDEPLFGSIGDYKIDALLDEVGRDVLQLYRDYLVHVIAIKGVEHHGAVDAVEELGAEEALDLVEDVGLHPFVGLVFALAHIGTWRRSR